jgi:hypothetical protein
LRAGLDHAYHRQNAGEQRLHLAGHGAERRRPAAAIGHVHHLHAGERLEQLGRHVRAASRAIGRVVELARPRLRIGDELRERIDRQRRRHHQHGRRIGEQRNQLDLGLRIVVQVLVERRVRGHADAGDAERVAVGLGAHDRHRADVGVAAGPVDDDDGLAVAFGKAVAQHPRHEAGAAARRERHDQLDLPRGIVIGARGRDGRGNGQRRQKARCQLADHPAAFALSRNAFSVARSVLSPLKSSPICS